MRLVIAEKPSVAQSIAAVLGAKSRHDGYLEGGGYIVSWCFGHLAELADAAVLVVRQNQAGTALLRACVSTLRGTNAKLLGCVLNDCHASILSEQSSYGYGYGYGYGNEKKMTLKTRFRLFWKNLKKRKE